MCNITWYQPGVMPKKKEFFNTVYNNWHGFGLVLKADNKLQIIQEVPEENDPEAIWELLEKNKDIERYLHLRHATSGEVTLENAHPFPVISSKKADIVFMHNGTMNDYDPKLIQSIPANDPRKEWSDSRLFCEDFLRPLFVEMKGGADLHSAMVRRILNKFWPAAGNRGILISSAQMPALLGSWLTRDGEDGEKYATSNDQYFNEVTRGPEKTRIEAKKAEERRAEEAKRKEAGGGATVLPFNGKVGNGRLLRNDHFTKVSGITPQWLDIASDPALYDDENLLSLANLTAVEMEQLMTQLGDDVVYFILYLTNAVRDSLEENQRLRKKNAAASKLIATHRGFYPDLPNKVQGRVEEVWDDLPGVFTTEEKLARETVSDQLVDNYLAQTFPAAEPVVVG